MTAHVAAAAFLMGILLPGQTGEGGASPEAGAAGSGDTPFASLLAGLAPEGQAITVSPAAVPGVPDVMADAPPATTFPAPDEADPDDAAAAALLALPLTVALPAPELPAAPAEPGAPATSGAAPAALAIPMPAAGGAAPAAATPEASAQPATQPAAPAPAPVPHQSIETAAVTTAPTPVTPTPASPVLTPADAPADPKPVDQAPTPLLTAPAADAPAGDDPLAVMALQMLAAVRGEAAPPAPATAPANDATDAIVLPALPAAPRTRAVVTATAEPAEGTVPVPRPTAGFSTMLLAQAANDDAPAMPAAMPPTPAPAAAVPDTAAPAAPAVADLSEPGTATAEAPAKSGTPVHAAQATPQAAPAVKAAEAKAPEAAPATAPADATAATPAALPVSPAASAASRIAADAAAGTTTARSLPHPAVDQVTVAVRRALDGGSDRIRVQLWPEDLGHVDVTLRLRDDGRVSAAIAVDRPETLDLFHQESRGLERAFEQAGFRTEAGDVSLSLRGGGQGQAGYAFGQEQGRGTPQQASAGNTRLAAETAETPMQPRRDASRVVDIHA